MLAHDGITCLDVALLGMGRELREQMPVEAAHQRQRGEPSGADHTLKILSLERERIRGTSLVERPD